MPRAKGLASTSGSRAAPAVATSRAVVAHPPQPYRGLVQPRTRGRECPPGGPAAVLLAARSRQRSDKVFLNFLSTIPAVMALVTGVLGTGALLSLHMNKQTCYRTD